MDSLSEYLSDLSPKKRLLVLLILFSVVVLGTGVGTIAFDGQLGPGGNETTPDPPVVDLTPVPPTATPTANPGDGPPTVTSETEVTTPTERPTHDTPTEPPAETATDRPATLATAKTPSNGGGSSGVDLQARGSTVLVQFSDIAPGDGDTNTVVFENAGQTTGRFVVENVTVEDRESSLLDVERAAGDDRTTGELSAAVRLRLWVTYPGGRTEYLFGNATTTTSLADIDGESRTSTETLGSGAQATVTFAWKIPDSTGNDVQSDQVRFDVDFVLQQTSG